MLRIGDIDCGAHADPCRDGQGPQGSACHAVATASGVAARMVVAMPVERLAVSGPGSTPANYGAPAQPRLPHGGRGGRARQLGYAAYAATLVRHASLGEQYRRAGDSGVARSNDILPANTRSRGGSTIRSIRGAARWCLSSSNTPTVAPIWLSFRNPTDRSPASLHG